MRTAITNSSVKAYPKTSGSLGVACPSLAMSQRISSKIRKGSPWLHRLACQSAWAAACTKTLIFQRSFRSLLPGAAEVALELLNEQICEYNERIEVGAGRLPLPGTAEADQGHGHTDCSDLHFDLGRSASFPQEPRRGLLPGTAVRRKKLRPERAADAHQVAFTSNVMLAIADCQFCHFRNCDGVP